MDGQKEKIIDFFNQDATERDQKFFSDPILAYEQNARQEAILSLINSHYMIGLDAGCGNGRDFNMLLQHTRNVVGIDFSNKMVSTARIKVDKSPDRRRIDLTIGDVGRLPFRDSLVDLIVCLEVLEHMPGWLQALDEFSRALRPEGELIISTPNKLSIYGLTRYLGRRLFGSGHPYDKWKSYFQLRTALEHAGFTVIGVRGACYLPGDFSYYQPFKQVIIFCLKLIKFLESSFLSNLYPFSLLGYMIIVRSKKEKRPQDDTG